MALNDIQPARTVATAGRKRVRIDWTRGASLLIEGEKPAAVAAALGIDEDRLWRHLRSSLRFQFLLRQARERRRLLGRLRLEAVSGDAAVRGALQVEKSDAAMLERLAIESRIATVEDTSTTEGRAAESRDVIARLADSTRRAPNQALHRRFAVERRKMDAEVDETRRLLAAQVARQEAAARQQALQQARQRPQPDAAAVAQAADKPSLTENKPAISPDKPAISPDKPQPAPDKVETVPEAHPASPHRALPLAPLAMHGSGAIVDLTDLYGNPLGGDGADSPDRHPRA